VGLGFWQLGSKLWANREPEMGRLLSGLEKALETGVNLLDTAEVYGAGASEKMLGEALRRLGAREEFVVVSKVAGFRSGEDDIVRGAEGVRRRLGFPPDVLLHHWPPPAYSSVCSVVRGLERAVSIGLASSYGLSNYWEELVERVFECSRRIEPLVDQIQYSLAYRAPENRLMPMLAERGMGVMAWSPLAKGALAGVRKPATKGSYRGYS